MSVDKRQTVRVLFFPLAVVVFLFSGKVITVFPFSHRQKQRHCCPSLFYDDIEYMGNLKNE